MILPQLFDRDSSGNIKTWQISTNGPDIITTHGKLGFKQITNVKTITTGKNIGRSNETTPVEQAEAEARSTYQKKLDKGYVEELEDAESKPKELLPMLAHKFKERGHNILYPCYVQPKLNGVRVLAKMLHGGQMVLISRGGKFYTTLGHITTTLQGIMRSGQIFDGEVYNHDWSLQRIVSAVKKNNEDTCNLEYHVYDMVTDNDFRDRLKYLRSLNFREGKVKLVRTYAAASMSDVTENHDAFVGEGYEGLMVRNRLGTYTLKNRSVNLQKLKEFEDDEFPIIGGKEGVGLDSGCVVFQCQAANGNKFWVRPKGSVAYRRELFQQLPSLVGRAALTTRHQGYTDDGLPVFPVGLVIRDYE